MNSFSSTFNEPINWQAASKTGALSESVKKHIVKCYVSLMVTLAAAGVGSYVHHLYHVGGLITTIGLFASLIYFTMTPPTEENLTKRFATLTAFGFLKGCSIGPLVSQVLHQDSSIVMTALLGTSVVFASFSAAALFAKRRSYLYLGGFLGSCLSLLFWGGLINMFFRSTMFFNVQLYLGLLMFCGYVIFDTQLIVEKAAQGDNDFLGHSLKLFVDFIAIFVRLLIILSRNSEKKRERR